MKTLAAFTLVLTTAAFAAPSQSATEFNKRWNNARKLTVAVAEAMPPNEYEFRPDPGAMSFGEQLIHLAQANYAFGAGLKDTTAPDLPVVKSKTEIVKFVADSFDYLSSVIANLTTAELAQEHNSPDGRLTGRDILLALYIHMGHHRGQAEVYLRVKGITPPQYVF